LHKEERWFDEVPVSGGLRVGLMFEDETGLMPGFFFAWLPERRVPGLCAQISSRDGRYEGQFLYDLDDSNMGRIRLAWASDHSKELSEYEPKDLAILAWAGEDCEATEGPFVVTAWSEEPTVGDPVVLLNSDDPTSLVLVKDGAVLDETGCLELQGVARSFNLRCSLPNSWQDTAEAEVFVRVRERAGRRIRFRDLPLPLAGR
jgi:hypothetical protein